MSELKFKYLNEIDISDSLTDSAHVIVEDGGNIRRAPMNQLVAGGGASVQADWNQNDETAPDYVKNRTHWVEGSVVTIEWDGNTEGRDSFSIFGTTVYKISDETPTTTDLTGGTLQVDDSPDGVLTEISFYEVEGGFSIAGNVIVVQSADAFAAPSTGVYATPCSTLTLTYGSTTYHPLDEAFIPDTIARTADIPKVNYPVTSVNGMTGDVVIEGGSGGGVTSWNDLEDKPFGEEGGLEVIIENESPEMTKYGDFLDCQTLIIPLIAGEKYKVILDGTEYQFTATEGELHGNQFVYIGSEQMFNDINTGIDGDFFIASVWENGQCVYTMFDYVSDTTSVTLSVYKDAIVIYPLDEKFIPDTIARATDIPEVNYPVTSVNGMMGDVVVNTFSGSWNDLTDKPSPKASGVITWDCSTEDRESFVMNEMITYYRVADLPSDNLTITRSENSNGGYNDSTESIFKAVEGEGCTQYNCNYILLVYSENFTFGDTSHTASPGVYFAKMTYNGNTSYTTSATYECPVPDATGETVTAAEFNALLAALRAAGYLAT